MKNYHRILITIGILLLLVIIFYLITSNITKYTGAFIFNGVSKEKDFINCLKKKDITLYINTDSIETFKNVKLADYLENIKIFNCFKNNQVCSNKKINSFPSWIIEGKKVDRDIDKFELSEYSGCKL